jgi:hypothetical protein
VRSFSHLSLSYGNSYYHTSLDGILSGLPWVSRVRTIIYQLKAERKAGDWLAIHVDHRGATAGNELQDETRLPAGIDKNESHRWQMEASVPESLFNEWVDESLATGKEISANLLPGQHPIRADQFPGQSSCHT